MVEKEKSFSKEIVENNINKNCMGKFRVKKRDGTNVSFDSSKILSAINCAYASCGKTTKKEVISRIIERLNDCYESEGADVTIGVEKIQDTIVSSLKDYDFDVCKAFIIYREQHRDLRLIAERASYIKEYTESKKNAATSSELDANANTTYKNVATLEAEVYKPINVKLSRYRVQKEVDKLFPNDKLNYDLDLEKHYLYKHDESSSQAIKPYTYSSREVVNVLYKDKKWLIPLYMLYDLVDTKEVLVDTVNEVYQKKINISDPLSILDINGSTNVSVVTKKKRHRDLVRVKTSFGEDIVVTDNHPMIIDKDAINNTVEAITSLGNYQYKTNQSFSFKGNKAIALSTIPNVEVFNSYITLYDKPMKKVLELTEKFGYFVGFFIGDGNFNITHDYIDITQKAPDILHTLNNILFESLGIIGKIHYKKETNNFALNISNKGLFYILNTLLGIQDKSYNKTLPLNIEETNENFAKGILAGLIDSDGTVNKTQLSIRLASRTAILQTTVLLKYFGYSVGNTMQNLPFSNNIEYKTNYTIWGVNCSKRKNCVDFKLSYKLKNISEGVSTSKYIPEGKVKITSVSTIEEASYFMQQNDYIYDITTDTHTFSCNNILVHNCVAVNLYPFLQYGTSTLDGLKTQAPKNLNSFTGQFNNLVFLLSSQFQGAVAFGEFFNVFNYYCVMEFGSNYYTHDSSIVSESRRTNKKTMSDVISQAFQNIVYSINQPAGNRSYQSPFTNISYYDSNYWKALFDDFVYPDGTKPEWEAINYLQKKFIRWFNEERNKCLLTFPVETMALLTDNEDVIDKEYKDLTVEMYAKGHSFFTYLSDNADSLSSCCRLKNKLEKNAFSFTNGLTGVATGSKSVITLNLNRIIQDSNTSHIDSNLVLFDTSFLEECLEKVYKYHTAYNELLWKLYDNNMLPVYSKGFIHLNQQFLTVGINGLNEAAEYLGIEVSDNNEYRQFCNSITKTISSCNREAEVKYNVDKNHKLKFNTEFVPAENLAIKNYNWDKEDGYKVPTDRNCYNSYFYKPEDESISILEKFRLHGREYVDTLDGGVALHCNLDEHLSTKQYEMLLEYAVKNGTNYFTFNIPNSSCDDCGYITKSPISVCPNCWSKNITWWTRIIGYLRPIKAFSEGRKLEANRRIYNNGKIIN